jgi:hypothetical protein
MEVSWYKKWVLILVSSSTYPLFIILFTLIMTTTGCWHRQCPIKGCMVKYEHIHGGKIVRGRGTFPKIHFFGMAKTASAKQDRANAKRRKRK